MPSSLARAIGSTSPVGMPMDVILQPGEEIRDLADGDRSPVERRTRGRSGSSNSRTRADGDTGRPHVLITVPKAGLSNGLTLTTTKRTYYLDLQSPSRRPLPAPCAGRIPMTRRRWRKCRRAYGLIRHNPSATMRAMRSPRVSHRPVWTVRQVVDDGRENVPDFPADGDVGGCPVDPARGLQRPRARQCAASRQRRHPGSPLQPGGARLGASKRAEVVTIQRLMPRDDRLPWGCALPRLAGCGGEGSPMTPVTIAFAMAVVSWWLVSQPRSAHDWPT